ncbi:methionine adenosyltransferase [Kitasatospora atroaurantiaca]|uniref:Methionine adenosyltransferase n=1 Tax=Kitasatospora atroaurantiaca TaxID=285545 RepID=A0A561EI06_9ACTN|nr:methionine adenosyltransferase [Kitasatospora atroaurantiaca]TWE15203.1 methionine adenosyltransferase [Kitasatospora atroaurantiaca]
MRVMIRHACTSPDHLPFDVAERKGIGHPDSLADLVADTFSVRYSRWCLSRFALVPNHWVDKVNLVGAAADVDFGAFDILKPVDAYLFGKITDRVGDIEVPVAEIFEEAVADVLARALGDARILDHVRLHVNNTRGTSVDHAPEFYRPRTLPLLADVLAVESVANDTVICVGTSLRGLAAEVAMGLESELTDAAFRVDFPAVGTDVKVMTVRAGSHLDVTAAVPFHPERIASWEAYRDCLAEVESAITQILKGLVDRDPRARAIARTSLHLNTKDSPGRGYLAPFGTSLGKGDCGAVGRGNRYNGVIEPMRPAGCEAPAGKNPVHHVGKIYSAIAAQIARDVFSQTSVYAEVTVATRNGGSLDDPAYVLIALDREPDASTARAIDGIVRQGLADVANFTNRFLTGDPIARFPAPRLP